MAGMNIVPVDVSQLTTPIVVLAPDVKTDMEGTAKTDRDGNVKYSVGVTVALTGARRIPDVIEVITTRKPEGVAVGTPVRLLGLRARPWQMGDRSGLSFSAEAIVPAVSPGASLTNGDDKTPSTANTPSPAPKPGKPGGA